MSAPLLQVVGPGRAGLTVARAFAEAGIARIGEVAARSAPVAAAATLGGRPVTLDAMGPGDWWLLAVPDDALATVAAALAERHGSRAELAFHLSGATAAASLDGLAREVASFHPVRSFPRPLSPSALTSVFVGIGGTVGARTLLRAAAKRIAMRPFEVMESTRARYHAACSVASNYPVMLAGFAADLFALAGIDEDLAKPLAASLLGQAAEGVDSLGPAAALTGPIARGDAGTLARQAAGVPARERPAFLHLAAATITFALATARIDAKTAAALHAAIAPYRGDD